MQRVQGFGEQGGKKVVTEGHNGTTLVQGSYPFCTVTIYPNGSNTPVPGNSIFSDNGSTVLGNPFTADANGHWFFYAANGRYDIKLSGTIPTWTIGDVLLADPAQLSIGVTSFNGRMGAVVPASGDYSWSQLSNRPLIFSSDYNFAAQTPGVSIGSGAQSIPLAPVPLGVNSSDAGHYLYISDGASSEAVKIIGGSAVSGASSGTITVTCANSHSGAWTVRSATAGMQEAVNVAYAAGGGLVQIPGGYTDVYALTTIFWRVAVEGAGSASTIIRNHSTTTGVFRLDAPFDLDFSKIMSLKGVRIASSAIGRTTVDVSAAAIFINVAGWGAEVSNVIISNHSIGIYLDGALYVSVSNFFISIFDTAGIYHNYGDGTYLSQGAISNVGNTSSLAADSSGIYIIQYGGFYAHDIDVTGAKVGIRLLPPNGGHCYYGFWNHVLADSCTGDGWYFDTSLGGAIVSNQFVDCWASLNGGTGLYVNGNATYLDGFTIIGGRWRENYKAGIEITAGQFITITGAEIGSNYQDGTSGPGIAIQAGTHVLISSNHSGNGAGSFNTPSQGYGLLMVGGAGTDYLNVSGNDFTPVNAAPVAMLNPLLESARASFTGNLGIDDIWYTDPAPGATLALTVYPSALVKTGGATAIATISGGWIGRKITVMFTNATPGGFANSGNVARTQAAVQYQVITLTFDGTKWY